MKHEEARYHVGTTIAGRYYVERPIGEGAMGTVALARHLSLDEKVAIKFLRPELRRDPVAIARLSREARVLSRIKSDHVARVLDVGATLAIGPYVVMEYLEGADLGEVLEAEGPLPVERVVEIVMQLCEALTVAHTAGIVHRDIKPQNLFLARHGQFETVKVLDFGISEDEPGSSSAATPDAPTGEAIPAAPLYGTPSYMSPERIRNDRAADHRSDIWSIGVVLHELVTGRAVFDAPSLTETCARVVQNAPLELETDDRILPASLRSLIARCLERDPSRRYQSVEELAAALAPLGTMTERFRGRSTGAFSRKYVEEQLALSRTRRRQPPPLGASPPAANELSAALGDIGVALRGVARAVPLARFHARPLWQYAAIALSGALAVTLVVSLGGNVPWVAPPSAPLRGEPLEPGEKHAVRGVDEPTPGALGTGVGVDLATSAASLGSAAVDERALAATPLEQTALDRTAREQTEAEEPAPASVTGGRAAWRDRVAAKGKTPRAERAAKRRKRAASKLPLAPREGFDEAPLTPSVHLVPERRPRARLVAEKRAAQRRREREARAAAEPTQDGATRPAAPSSVEAPSPEQLEPLRSDTRTP